MMKLGLKDRTGQAMIRSPGSESSARRLPRQWMAATAATACIFMGACTASPPAPSPSAAAGSARSTPAAAPDIAGTFNVGAGRQMFLECHGTGSPTVVLISGTGSASSAWSSEFVAGDPSAAPTTGPSTVFKALPRTTRVCAYDRPGTVYEDDSPTPSTPVRQPTTAQQGVTDLAALLRAAGESGPYVVVGHSWGGMIAQLFARTHSSDVRGIVLVDSASAYLKDRFTPAQWTTWMAMSRPSATAPDAERPDYAATIAESFGAGQGAASPGNPTGAPPPVAAVVLSSDQPWDLHLGGGSTWPAWLQAQADLAASLHARHVSNTGSGHGIQYAQPKLVTDAILDVVGLARKEAH